MKLWNDENEKFALMREKLYTPVVGDILDELGYYHQFLPQDIRPPVSYTHLTLPTILLV